jgi:hypothetical protein
MPAGYPIACVMSACELVALQWIFSSCCRALNFEYMQHHWVVTWVFVAASGAWVKKVGTAITRLHLHYFLFF